MFNKNQSVDDYMSIIVTHDCTRNCKFCVDLKRNNTGVHIKNSDVENAIKFAKSKNIKDILITGGEPTLHPDIYNIVKTIKDAGFRTILTTNFDNLDIVYSLDNVVDCFNFSYYGQKYMPNPKNFHHADLTLSSLIYKEQLNTKEKLDTFIDFYRNLYHLKFSTLTRCNEYTSQNYQVDYLDYLPDSEYVILFNEIVGQIYKGVIIKRYDRVVNPIAKQSYKFNLDGTVSSTWN